MQKTSLVLTVLGQDHPGLVDSLAAIVAEHGGNWVESRMAHLAGQFAGILRVEVDPQQAESLTAAIKKLTASGLESMVCADPIGSSVEGGNVIELDLVGLDQPGIVRKVSQVLAERGVNVEQLATECLAAPNTGQSLFHATAKLRLPEGLEEGTLRGALEQVAADLMVELKLE
ncbi:glycine cleavage system protein R [Bythopirellula goksoeyrii]|nr:ACT domain-containing protein [Bythopirellula goksoeyrii]